MSGGTDERAPRATGASRVGRLAATALFWVTAAWVCISGFASVIPQVFWPAEARGAEASSPEDGCGPALHALYDEALDIAARHARPGAGDLPAELAAWDARYHGLSAACGEHPGYGPLARLRHGVEDHLDRYSTTQTPLAIETLAAIESQR